MKRHGFSVSLVAFILMSFIAACQGGVPQVEYIVEVPVTRIVTVVATPAPDGTAVAEATAETTAEVTMRSVPPTTTVEPTIEATEEATPSLIPTPERLEIFVAEQVFQNGYMFWLRPIDQIWVIGQDSEGKRIWQIFEDTFEEGMPESDPELLPPVSGLYQPVRGFGKLWRENQNIQSQLGWATQEEVGYLAIYEYHYGGTVVDGEYVQGPGYHILRTNSGDVFRFNEGVWTWEIVTNVDE